MNHTRQATITQGLALRPLAVALTLALAGCATTSREPENNAKVDARTKALGELLAANAPKVHEGAAPLEIAPLDRAKQDAIDHAWLRSKKVDFIPNKKDPRPIAATEVLKMFRENGINITSSLPLDNYNYTGNGLKGADGESALQLILGQMGLDFDIDNRGKFITVVPMKSQSWTINLGNRSSYSTNSNFDSLCSMSGNGTQNNQSGTAATQTGTSGTANGMGMGMPSVQSTTGANTSTSSSTNPGSSIQTQDNFWPQLEKELTQRLQILVPAIPGTAGTGTQATPQINPTYGGQTTSGPTIGGNGLYVLQRIGSLATNPVTGQVTVQAPSWLLRQINAYMEEVVLPRYNTSMTFEGMIVTVSSTRDESKGFDLSALATYAGKYGFILNNNILGNITYNATGIPSAAYSGAATLPGGGAAFGLISPKDNLQLFNAFLSTIGGTEVVQRPIVNTTSGAPVDFGRMKTYWTNQQSQTLAAGNVNSNAIATIQNNFVKYEYGSLLRIMPHYDPKSRRIRAQISLLQKPLNGYQDLPNSIMAANGTVQNTTVRIPNIGCEVISSDTLLDDGEMIILGGQTEDTTENTQNGVTGLMDIKGLDLFTSKKRDTGSRSTTYFAIRVRLNAKPTKTL